MKGWFIFNCTTEYDEVVLAIVEADLESIFTKSEEIGNSPVFNDVASVAFWDSIDAYDSLNEEEFLKPSVAEKLERDGWAWLTEDPGEPAADNIRATVERLHISKNGFWWSLVPKHTSENIETPYITIRDAMSLQGMNRRIR